MKRDLRLLGKFIWMLTGCFFLLFLLGKAVVRIVEPVLEKQHAYMTLQEAGNLVWLLAETGGDPDAVLRLLPTLEGNADTILLYKDAKKLTACLPEADEGAFGRYADGEQVRTEDFFAWFDDARKIYDKKNLIREEAVYVLGSGDAIKGEVFSDKTHVYTQNGFYTAHAAVFYHKEYHLKKIRAIAYKDALYGIREVNRKESIWLENVWVIDANREKLHFFWKDHEILFSGLNIATDMDTESRRECVANLRIGGGLLREIDTKEEKVSGTILRVTEEGVEISEKGFYPFAKNPAFYRLYGTLKSLSIQDLRIGYDFTDFVLEDGKIAAGLTVREESMEKIRVLIQNAGYSGRFHEEIRLYADTGCTVYFGEKENYSEKISAGEEIKLEKSSHFFDKNTRIRIVPDALTGKIYLPDVTRNNAQNGYRGTMEISLSEEGLVLINEVLLEEYLYAVVPSEMPSSYPMEALKSQAVCARTYAYQKMCSAGLGEYGAHLDDSTAFQVYQNQPEQPESTQAVKETKGMTIFWQQKPAEVFFYSTSSGFGTDASVWQETNKERYPYLVSQAIENTDTGAAYEQAEPWYLWQYSVNNLNRDEMERRIYSRYQSNPSNILTMQADGSFVSEVPAMPGDILHLYIKRDTANGPVKELIIEGTLGCIKVLTEYGIRYVLCDGRTEVIRQDNTAVSAPTIMPSAFFSLEEILQNGIVTGYEIKGGGYGHGVGMSQNAAKHMAKEGMKYEEILSFFYKDCIVEDIYGNEEKSL